MHQVTLHGCTLYNCDCISGAAAYLPDNSIDLIITDPPYGIQGDLLHRHYNRNEGFVAEGYREVPREEYAEFSRQWIRQAERILRPGASIYIVSGYTNLADILMALRETSLVEINHIIWKYSFGVFTRQKYISSHYHILLYAKPGGVRTFNLESRFGLAEKDRAGRSLNTKDREDVWCINREYKPRKVKNKNELPLTLLVKMIQYSSNEGDLIADLFLGGFSTAMAAIGLNRRVTGFEIAKPVFDARTAELHKVRPGSLLPALREPVICNPVHAGTRWSVADRDALISEFRRLSQEDLPKKEIVARLQERFGRGRWAIEKALKKGLQ